MNVYIVTYMGSCSNLTVHVVAENLVKMLEAFKIEHNEDDILRIEVMAKDATVQK